MIAKNFWICSMLILAVSCRSASKPSDALAAANMAALETTVDMENREVETASVLGFPRIVVIPGVFMLG